MAQPPPHAMADSAASSSARSQGSSTAKGRARAAPSASHDRAFAQAAVDPEPHAVGAASQETGDTAPSLHFDPRQGTLLGFELPADVLVSITNDDAQADADPVAQAQTEANAQVARSVKGRSAGGAKPVDEPPSREPAQSNPVVEPDQAAGAPPGQIARPARSERQAASPAAVVAAAGPTPGTLAQTVASLQEALARERLAGDEHWRRARHWLVFALAGIALLLAVAVVQTVALVGFVHHTQAAQQQTQSALNDQQAALSRLASATLALTARAQPVDAAAFASAPGAADTGNAAQRAAKQHPHHVKDKAKPAAH